MTSGRPDVATALREVETVPVAQVVVRCLPQLDWAKGEPPRYLYTSGRPNRWNPRGVECVYFSLDERTANEEYESYWRPIGGHRQPKLTVTADVRLGHVVDVSVPAVCEGLGLTEADLSGGWRDAAEMTRPQALGAAIAEQTRISGVVYPSVKARGAGFEGSNLVIFRHAVVAPDVVSILGRKGDVLEQWP